MADSGEAFFSAWGFMASKSVLLIGLLILSLELRQLGISRTEAFVVWGLLGVALGKTTHSSLSCKPSHCSLVLVFVTAAVATGFLRCADRMRRLIIYLNVWIVSSNLLDLRYAPENSMSPSGS